MSEINNFEEIKQNNQSHKIRKSPKSILAFYLLWLSVIGIILLCFLSLSAINKLHKIQDSLSVNQTLLEQIKNNGIKNQQTSVETASPQHPSTEDSTNSGRDYKQVGTVVQVAQGDTEAASIAGNSVLISLVRTIVVNRNPFVYRAEATIGCSGCKNFPVKGVTGALFSISGYDVRILQVRRGTATFSVTKKD